MRFVQITRPSRYDLIRSEDEVFHVYNRGVDRQQLFFSDFYYTHFLTLTEQFLDQAELRLLGYCLMPNHFHLMVKQLKSLAISYFMERLAGAYVKTVNVSQKRVGHLLQGRYGIKCVWAESGIPVLANYLHQNPVKAGLVVRPEDWLYSSCREYFNERPAGILDLQEVLSRLDGAPDYRSFLARSHDAELDIPYISRFRE